MSAAMFVNEAKSPSVSALNKAWAQVVAWLICPAQRVATRGGIRE